MEFKHKLTVKARGGVKRRLRGKDARLARQIKTFLGRRGFSQRQRREGAIAYNAALNMYESVISQR